MATQPSIVLCAVDLGDATATVLAHAIELASRGPSVLHVVFVQEPAAPTSWDGVTPFLAPPMDPKIIAERLRDEATRALSAFRATHPAATMPEAEVHAAWGSPAAEIVWLAEHLDADAIVVGTHGRRGARRLLLGSVAERVVRLAGCPVIVAREKRHAAPWKLSEVRPICPECAAIRAESSGARLLCERHLSSYQQVHLD
jgi:nucleotide-binding universal stress UspA family protein